MTAREDVLNAAQRLFAERGYAHVTIRQIAAESGYSPSMVMKVGGSKERIYADATPPALHPLDPDWPQDRTGIELVRRIVQRRGEGAVEPWLQALLAAVDSPDPVSARTDFRADYLAKLERRIGATGPEERRAEVVAAMLIGLAAAVRIFHLVNDDTDWVIERYGSLIQSVIDSQNAGD